MWTGTDSFGVKGDVAGQRSRRRLALVALVAVVGLGGARFAKADTAAVSATVQPVSGGVYEYQYTVTGTFAANDVLAIYFPVATSGALVNESMTDADWSTSVLQPDSNLPADGELDLMANVASPGLQQVFAAQFAYSGTGMPGLQAFTLYDGNFDVLQTGMTTAGTEIAPVPEPGTLALLGTGGLGMLGVVRRRLRA